MLNQEQIASLGAQTIKIGGHHPFVLDNPLVVWFVQSGTATVFSAKIEHGFPVGSRRLLFNTGVSDVLFPLTNTQQESRQQLMVLPSDELLLLEIPLKQLEQACEAIGTRPCDAIDGWATKVSAFVAAGTTPPGRLDTISDGDTMPLAATQIVRAKRDNVSWISIDKGTAQIIGIPEIGLTPNQPYLPVGADIWIQAMKPLTLTSVSSADLPDARTLLDGIFFLHEFLLHHIVMLDTRAQEEERIRLDERDTTHQHLAEDALIKMAAVINPTQNIPQRHTPLLSAISIVGDALGITIHPPAQSETLPRLTDYLKAIARASHVRHRQVRLTEKWWENDCGPLVAYLKDGDHPVALLRTRGARYEIINPSSGTRIQVNKQTAQLLAPKATMLYRSLPNDANTLWQLMRFSLRRRFGDIAFVMGLSVISALIGMLTPQVMAVVMDTAIPDANGRLLIELGLALFAAAIGMALFGLAQGILGIRVATAIDTTMQAAVWDRVLKLRVSFFKRFSSGDLLSRVTAVSDVTDELNGATLAALLASVMALLNLGLLFYYSSELALIAVGLVGIVALITIIGGYLIRQYTWPLLEIEGHFYGFVVQLISAVGKIRVAGAEQRAFSVWAKKYTEQLTLIMKAQRIEDFVILFNQTLPLFSTILIYWFGIKFLSGGASITTQAASPEGISLGIFLAFNIAMGTFIGGATSLSETVVELMDTMIKSKRMKPILDAPMEIDNDTVDPGQLTGAITLSHIDFRYTEDGPKIIDDVTIHVAPGEFVALTGPSGCGKSTIFRLLLGFETPEGGSISYDKKPMMSLDITAIRRQIGAVLQSGRINSGSIFENISIGESVTLDEVWDAVADAGFADDVQKMPMGMHTVISEGGTNLSGGQRQRLLIARALLLKPKILLMDEATSALDNKTQAIVSESLERRKVSRILIAHRLSTIQNATRIYVLDHGRIIETGSYNDLVKMNGLFTSMMARQVA